MTYNSQHPYWDDPYLYSRSEFLNAITLSLQAEFVFHFS